MAMVSVSMFVCPKHMPETESVLLSKQSRVSNQACF